MPPPKLYEFTEYETPDGVVYRFETGTDKFLISEVGFGMPPLSMITSRAPLQHGATLHDYRADMRVIQLVHRRNSCGRQAYWSSRSDLIDHIRPNRSATQIAGTLRKRFSNGDIREIGAVIEQGPEFTARNPQKWDEWSFTETLRFLCPDPFFTNPVQKTASLVLSSSTGMTFPFSLPLIIDDTVMNLTLECTTEGTEEAWPTIVLTGPMSGMIITNEENAAQLHIVYSVSGGETLTITLEPGNKRAISDINGDVSGILFLSDISSFRLLPDPMVANGTNTIRFKSSGIVPGGADSAVTMSWYDKDIGI